MNVVLFALSPYLKRPNVLVGLDCCFFNGVPHIDNVSWSQEAAIIEGVHICEKDLLEAVIKFIRNDCKYATLMIANEETQEFEEVL